MQIIINGDIDKQYKANNIIQSMKVNQNCILHCIDNIFYGYASYEYNMSKLLFGNKDSEEVVTKKMNYDFNVFKESIKNLTKETSDLFDLINDNLKAYEEKFMLEFFRIDQIVHQNNKILAFVKNNIEANINDILITAHQILSAYAKITMQYIDNLYK
jgi:hypothetical protein